MYLKSNNAVPNFPILDFIIQLFAFLIVKLRLYRASISKKEMWLSKTERRGNNALNNIYVIQDKNVCADVIFRMRST